jgi:hypothetical protein
VRQESHNDILSRLEHGFFCLYLAPQKRQIMRLVFSPTIVSKSAPAKDFIRCMGNRIVFAVLKIHAAQKKVLRCCLK